METHAHLGRVGLGSVRPGTTDDALGRLYAATAAISAVIDDEPRLLRTVAEEFATLVGARYGALGILGDDGTLKGFYTHGLTRDEEDFLRPTPPVGLGILGAMLVEGKPLRIDNIGADPRRSGMPPGHPPMRCFLGVPLIASSRVIGRLYATERGGEPFTSADETLAMGFAAAAAVAIDSAWRTTRLVESERLRAAGELAVGIAHDFNNLLSTIIGRVEVILTSVTDEHLASSLEAIRRAARDGAVIAGRMRQFGRAVDFDDFRPLDVNETVRGAIDFTRPRWHSAGRDEPNSRSIEVVAELGDVSDIDGDPVSIREALVNLIFNAIDALPHGGLVTVRTRVGSGRTVVIEVADTGTGIPPAVIAHIFTPFFTTKGARGSGLGLAMVKRVVDGHLGTVEVETAQGKGTLFTLTFPAIAVMPRAEAVSLDRPPSVPAKVVSKPRTAVRPASIVLVDDQADVLDTISLLLRLDGHHVRAFVSGREALEAVTVERPDLVITDLSMPAVSGWDVAQVVAQEAPGTPVIMLTGIGLAISAVEARDKGVAHVLHKPTDRETLRLAIDKVLSPTERVTSTLSVLVIDDSDDFRAAIALLLRSLGHVVVEASGVERARRHISSSSRIDVALLDVHLADGDPKEVLSLLRASRPAARAWVVSGSDVETMRTHVPDADLYIEKMELPDRLLNLSVTERE